MPQGLSNNISQKGIDHYNAVIDEVISNGLMPMVCSAFFFFVQERRVGAVYRNWYKPVRLTVVWL